jgi:hypothetical protein|tara:strand:- start:121 stop:813 length:693 start_codon:yes stop_codon:yes gene_type:complete
MKNWLFVFLLFQISCLNRSAQEDFQLQKGDFLFQDLDSSPLCDAIELVTPGYKGANFSHIGMVVELGDPYCINPDYNYNDHVRILEAFPTRVRTIRVDSFLNRSLDNNGNPKVIVGRLKLQYRYAIQNAISFSKSKIGMNYDDVFIINNNSYYCSELIYEAFEEDSIFQLQPMTFLHPETKDTLKIWKEYYSDLKVDIPQNKLGINPGIMSLSDKIEIVHFYGIPENFTE